MIVIFRVFRLVVFFVIVEVFVERDSIRFFYFMMIYVNVRKGFYFIFNVIVIVIIELEVGDFVMLKFFDDGVGNK